MKSHNVEILLLQRLLIYLLTKPIIETYTEIHVGDLFAF